VLTQSIRSEELLTPAEAADVLHTTRGHIYLLVRRAELPSVRVGKLLRIPSGAVRRLVAGAGAAR
jgi:excisionase family DNA binding protein